MKYPNASRKCRLEKGWTQEKTAQKIGYKSVKMISRIENCHVRPSAEKMFKYSVIFGKPISEIFFA